MASFTKHVALIEQFKKLIDGADSQEQDALAGKSLIREASALAYNHLDELLAACDQGELRVERDRLAALRKSAEDAADKVIEVAKAGGSAEQMLAVIKSAAEELGLKA